jgi:hypothetical protein
MWMVRAEVEPHHAAEVRQDQAVRVIAELARAMNGRR